jgi:hypothetical protein
MGASVSFAPPLGGIILAQLLKKRAVAKSKTSLFNVVKYVFIVVANLFVLAKQLLSKKGGVRANASKLYLDTLEKAKRTLLL